jgi:hypothetical protein
MNFKDRRSYAKKKEGIDQNDTYPRFVWGSNAGIGRMRDNGPPG